MVVQMNVSSSTSLTQIMAAVRDATDSTQLEHLLLETLAREKAIDLELEGMLTNRLVCNPNRTFVLSF